MKFVIAPDKYKGSLSGIEFCNAVEDGLKQVFPDAEILKIPLSDGGDGTIEILNYHLKGELVSLVVNDPLFRPVEASYLYMESINTAFIEMAEASGMKLLEKEEQNCFVTSTFGTGEIIVHALENGARTIVLGIGGSATNDCGIGMASALGYKFLDQRGEEVIPIGKNLSQIITIDASDLNKNIKKVAFKVACDVTNPLYGKEGAAFVYGPQKGASAEEIVLLDQGLKHLAKVLSDHFNRSVHDVEGAGAAGGMGAGTLAFLNAHLSSGIDLIKELIMFDHTINNADWIITGEGKMDSQTLSGKTIQGVLTSAKKQLIPVAALCGSIDLQKKEQENLGIAYSASIIDMATNLKDAMANSYAYLSIISTNFAKELKENGTTYPSD